MANSEEFKDTSNIFDNNQKNEDKHEKDCQNIFYSINMLGDVSQQMTPEAGEKDFNSLLEKVTLIQDLRLNRLVPRQTN